MVTRLRKMGPGCWKSELGLRSFCLVEAAEGRAASWLGACGDRWTTMSGDGELVI